MTDFLKKTLEESFKRVIIAADGVEALQLIKSHIPDIIVSDVMMPRMNGYELCINIKEDITISHIPLSCSRHEMINKVSSAVIRMEQMPT